MILIFGGTTEGRKAAAVCDEAGKPFYYSTKGRMQQLTAANGIVLTGGMDDTAMYDFCASHDIRLIVNAAHPFAEVLHANIARAADRLRIPVLRYERTYATRSDDITWFDTYDEAVGYLLRHRIEPVLFLTGVNTLSKLRPYWQKYDCRFRILDREESRAMAHSQGFPPEQLLYYDPAEDLPALFRRLSPQAILTKESGETGGFDAKAAAARQAGIPLFVIRRPSLSSSFISVGGEHTLRKEIERRLPDFFELKTGYTTGTCATAATKAALLTLLSSETWPEVRITLPCGEQVKIPVAHTECTGDTVTCTVIKDAGDDPDVTHGQAVCSTVRLNCGRQGVQFLQGEGVGVVTLPGLDIDIGGPAINRVPRLMMKREIFKVIRHYRDCLPDGRLSTGVDVTISVPGGEELARRTFNPKLGIVGGISIIGTSGIVRPFSSEAFVAAIGREVQVAAALGCRHLVINSGAKSERIVRQQYPDLPAQAFVHYGNFIGETLRAADAHGFDRLTLGIMIGKAVKLAEGFLDTHSKKVVMNPDFLTGLAQEAGLDAETVKAIGTMMMARSLWEIVPADKSLRFFGAIMQRCYEVCKPLFPKGELEVILIGE